MKNYTYQNNLIGKKQLRQLLAWSFTNYDSMQACALADELKYLGFKYASQSGISITIEDLRIPFVKNLMLEKANQEILNGEKIYSKGKITNVERFQKIIDTWSLTSESLKEQVINYFKNYDPLNSIYIMAFSGARGNLSQVRQLVGMRGLMSDPSGQIMNLPIKKNFREGLTITDYLMSGYGARKGIVDTALKTANSGYLTRRLIDVGQDILIREKDCLTTHSFLFSAKKNDSRTLTGIYNKILGRTLSKPIFDSLTGELIVHENIQMTPDIIKICKEKRVTSFYVRSPLTCNLYRAICQKCYGWDLANENLVDIGEAIGILAGQSIGEPGTQLTMRTFHTGGIFTSKARQQIISPLSGVIKFYKILETVPLRTNRGESVLITKNSGSLVIIPYDSCKELIKIKILKNTILFPKNNQYISKDTVIGELLDMNKQIKTEIKQIISDNCGEIFIPKLKKKINSNSTNNKLIWILSGNLYNSPKSSFVNFYPDSKLNPNSYIFRTKIVNKYSGNVKLVNDKLNLYQRLLRINNTKHSLPNSKLKKLTRSKQSKNYLLNSQNLTYLLRVEHKNSKLYLKSSRNQQIGISLNRRFRTLTGGIVYYDHSEIFKCNNLNNLLPYIHRNDILTNYTPIVSHRTIIWFGEESHKVNCESNILLVEHGDFISVGFELIPGLFSRTSGIVVIQQKSSLVQTISIKCGLVYEGKKFKNTTKKLYYPGELIISNIHIKTLSFCEQIQGRKSDQLLVNSIQLYESPFNNLYHDLGKNKNDNYSNLKLHLRSAYSYKSNQIVKGTQNLDLVSDTLNFVFNQSSNINKKIELLYNGGKNSVDLLINENITLNHYILPNLRYKDIKSCLLIQPKQFIDCYTSIGYLESLTLNSLEIVKFKIKIKDTKQVFLISNENCFNIDKKEFKTKKLNDFIINSKSIDQTGKVIISNEQLLTVQKGKPYFFPNCKDERVINTTDLEYKIISPIRIQRRFTTRKHIHLNYYDITKVSIKRPMDIKHLKDSTVNLKTEFSKLFLRKSGKFYSSLIPQFLKKFTIGPNATNLRYKQILQPSSSDKLDYIKLNRTLLLQSSELKKSNYKESLELDSKHQLVLLKFLDQPFRNTTKGIGLHSITEDYFEQDVNTVLWKNTEFIEKGETIGLLNLEKEITGDIVQGLPRIEEVLEVRKRNLVTKRMPVSKKKGLIIQKTNLDPNFEFKKLGTPIKDNEKVNPHKLLKVYFNYYGLRKFFICDRTKILKYNRLMQNDEGSYKSFKKVQAFILNSVQSVYQSQGVTINDKHLEVIIKQMTTKVLITFEGNTPLLRREVVDLYHIQYINKIVERQKKQPACYIPLLLGITKAALNNPSFISAASFQETTRVLTKAAIEGRIDWLRGLKENIVIGHLIPAGTGSQTYRNCFKKKLDFSVDFKKSFFDISTTNQKTGQVK
jgi:DNA-directed RNA polymerase beta'' subunit